MDSLDRNASRLPGTPLLGLEVSGSIFTPMSSGWCWLPDVTFVGVVSRIPDLGFCVLGSSSQRGGQSQDVKLIGCLRGSKELWCRDPLCLRAERSSVRGPETDQK